MHSAKEGKGDIELWGTCARKEAGHPARKRLLRTRRLLQVQWATPKRGALAKIRRGVTHLWG